MSSSSKNKENMKVTSNIIEYGFTQTVNFNKKQNFSQKTTNSGKKLLQDMQEKSLPNLVIPSSDNFTNELFTKIFVIRENLNSNPIENNFKFFNKNYLSEVYDNLREVVFYKVENLKDSSIIAQIESITNILLINFNLLENSINHNNTNQSPIFDLIHLLENLTYMYLFHFHIQLINSGLKIFNFLLKELDYEFHKQTLQKMIKILHILKSKKTVNALVCSKIINNISQAIMLIIHNTNQDTRKVLFDFVISNNEDFVLMWILCSACQGNLNFSKFFSVDSVTQLIEKTSKDIEKYNKALEMGLNSMKTEKSLQVKNKIKQSIDVIGCICKLIDSFNIQGNKTYNYDRVIKNNLIPALKKFWMSILFIQDSFFFDIDFSVESMATIITLSQNIDLLSFDLLLPLLNWTASILDKNLKYLVNLKQVIKLLAKILINMPEETSREIVSVVLQIIEKCLYVENPEQHEHQAQRSNISNLEFIHQYYIVIILQTLENFPHLKSIEFSEDTKKCEEFFNATKKLLDSQNNDADIYSSSSSLNYNSIQNLEIFSKEYKELLSSALVSEISFRKPTFSNANKNWNKLFSQSLLKYEEFKNSLKSLYGLESSNLLIDNKIINFIEKENEILQNSNNNINTQALSKTFENFFLETSIEMFREIFNQNCQNKGPVKK